MLSSPPQQPAVSSQQSSLHSSESSPVLHSSHSALTAVRAVWLPSGKYPSILVDKNLATKTWSKFQSFFMNIFSLGLAYSEKTALLENWRLGN